MDIICTESAFSISLRLKILHQLQQYLEPAPEWQNAYNRATAYLMLRAKCLHQLLSGMPERTVLQIRTKEMTAMLSELNDLRANLLQYSVSNEAYRAALKSRIEEIDLHLSLFVDLLERMNDLAKKERLELLEAARQKILVPLEEAQADWPRKEKLGACINVDLAFDEIRNSTSLAPLIHMKPAPAPTEEKEKR